MNELKNQQIVSSPVGSDNIPEQKNNNGEEAYFNTDDGASNCIIFKTESISKGKNDDEI